MKHEFRGKWLIFRLECFTGKTLVYDVRAAKSGIWLGDIRWASGWRQYAFYPASATFYEKTCLRDIASFVVRLQREHDRAMPKREAVR
jgi:hypothetical protein